MSAVTVGGVNHRAVPDNPYLGYYDKALTVQGPSAPGGERTWIANGVMRGGYAMLA